MDVERWSLTDEETQQVRELWGDELLPVPAELLDPAVPSATRHFLTTVGLPTSGLKGLYFFRDDELSTLIAQGPITSRSLATQPR